MDTQFERVRESADGLRVRFVGSRTVHHFPWWWLADHGENDEHRDPGSLQRLTDTFAIPDGVRPTACAVHGERRKLGIRWPAGPPTLHTADGLLDAASAARRLASPPAVRLSRPPSRSGVALWSTPAPDDARQLFDYAEVVRGTDTTVAWLRHIERWGFARLDRVPPGRAPVREIAAHLGYVRETIFGGVWDLSSDVADHHDSAYDTTFLGPHTDGTYSEDAPGLQLFVCQEREGTGGESILVDGFAAAARLYDAHLHHLEVLSRASVPGHYIEPGVSLRAEGPTLRFDPAGRLRQVRYNNYDRAPFMIRPTRDAEAFRDAWAAFHHMVSDTSAWTRIGWAPGQALVFDNWRILHGRESYTGRRRFLGAYTNREDFESKLRQLPRWSNRPPKGAVA